MKPLYHVRASDPLRGQNEKRGAGGGCQCWGCSRALGMQSAACPQHPTPDSPSSFPGGFELPQWLERGETCASSRW